MAQHTQIEQIDQIVPGVFKFLAVFLFFAFCLGIYGIWYGLYAGTIRQGVVQILEIQNAHAAVEFQKQRLVVDMRENEADFISATTLNRIKSVCGNIRIENHELMDAWSISHSTPCQPRTLVGFQRLFGGR